jgi:hypothetical protein
VKVDVFTNEERAKIKKLFDATTNLANAWAASINAVDERA